MDLIGYPDLQKHILSLFFPEEDHQAESYTLESEQAPVKRRLSTSTCLLLLSF